MPPFGHDTDNFTHVSLRDGPPSHLGDEETVNVPRPVYNRRQTDKLLEETDIPHHNTAPQSVADFDFLQSCGYDFLAPSDRAEFDHVTMLNEALLGISIGSNIFHHINPEPQRKQSIASSGKKTKSTLSTEEASQKLPAVTTSIQSEKCSTLKKHCGGAKKKNHRRVSFTSVHIREYFVVLGDHPCCSHGPPLSLGWDHTATAIMDLNSFEFTHSPRRTRSQLRLAAHVRENKLLDNAFNGCYYDDEYGRIVEEDVDESMGVFFLPRKVYKSMAMGVRE